MPEMTIASKELGRKLNNIGLNPSKTDRVRFLGDSKLYDVNHIAWFSAVKFTDMTESSYMVYPKEGKHKRKDCLVWKNGKVASFYHQVRYSYRCKFSTIKRLINVTSFIQDVGLSIPIHRFTKDIVGKPIVEFHIYFTKCINNRDRARIRVDITGDTEGYCANVIEAPFRNVIKRIYRLDYLYKKSAIAWINQLN